MKKLLATLLLFTFLNKSFAQVNLYGGVEDAYRQFMLQSHSQINKQILTDFLGVGGDKRFESSQWLQGGATNNFDVTIAGDYLFNYDFLGHELHAKWKDTNIVVNTSYVKRFFLVKDGRTHSFVKSPAVDAGGKYFFESLAFDEETNDSAKIQLLKLRTIKQKKVDKNSYLANYSGDYNDEYDNSIEYYVVMPDKTFTKVKLNKKSLTGALGKYKDRSQTYFKQIDQVNEETAGGLIRYLNAE